MAEWLINLDDTIFPAFSIPWSLSVLSGVLPLAIAPSSIQASLSTLFQSSHQAPSTLLVPSRLQAPLSPSSSHTLSSSPRESTRPQSFCSGPASTSAPLSPLAWSSSPSNSHLPQIAWFTAQPRCSDPPAPPQGSEPRTLPQLALIPPAPPWLGVTLFSPQAPLPSTPSALLGSPFPPVPPLSLLGLATPLSSKLVAPPQPSRPAVWPWVFGSWSLPLLAPPQLVGYISLRLKKIDWSNLNPKNKTQCSSAKC